MIWHPPSPPKKTTSSRMTFNLHGVHGAMRFPGFRKRCHRHRRVRGCKEKEPSLLAATGFPVGFLCVWMKFSWHILGYCSLIPEQLLSFEFNGILHVGPTKSLTFGRAPKGCHVFYTPEMDKSPLKRNHFRRKIIFQASIFSMICYVSLPEGMIQS